MAHGFTTDLLVDLVHEGLATATPTPCMLASGRSMLSKCGAPMPDSWRWPDDGLWACQLRQDAQDAHSSSLSDLTVYLGHGVSLRS